MLIFLFRVTLAGSLKVMENENWRETNESGFSYTSNQV